MSQTQRNVEWALTVRLLVALGVIMSQIALAHAQGSLGDRVLGKWTDGYWYPATIQQMKGEKFLLRFDDGDSRSVSQDELARFDWNKGTRVECNWQGKGKYFPGSISSREQDRLSIAYDDRDRETVKFGSCRTKDALAINRDTRGQTLEQLTAAAEIGSVDAQIQLGSRYFDGNGVPQDYALAVAWYRKAAEKGSAKAQYNLGLMYDTGKGVPTNKETAFAWYRRAGEQGVAIAQAVIGFKYAQGIGVRKDDKQALAWYRKAAQQGSVVAQHNLGNMYWHATGVSRDEKMAVEWYQKAAAQGYEDSRKALDAIAQARENPTQRTPIRQQAYEQSPAADQKAGSNSKETHDYPTYGQHAGKYGWHADEPSAMFGKQVCDGLDGCKWTPGN